VRRILRVPRARGRVAALAAAVALAAVSAAALVAAAPSTEVLRSIDTGLCPFALQVRSTSEVRVRRQGKSTVRITGPTTVVLRNRSTGRTAVLRAPGSSSLDSATGSLLFSGRHVWLGTENHVPFLSTVGRGSRLAPGFVFSVADPHPRVIDPCALVGLAPPALEPAATPAPWGLPDFALSRIAYAGLTPLVGNPARHDHVHLDVIVDGRKVVIPAGVGQAEPVDRGPGPCPEPPESRTIGDCAPGHYFTARVAASQLQTHTASGIVHLQSARGASFTLGQLFDEWGVRFDAGCIGAYCTGRGKELRVFVDGRRATGDPRKLVLTDRLEIAVVYGGPGDFASVPAGYALRWPVGCGGPGERPCLP
jgi:hypothetical protein